MYKRELYIVAPLFFVFMTHGILYYIFPQYQYRALSAESGTIQYIKYLCILAALPFLLRARANQQAMRWMTVGLLIMTSTFVLNLYWGGLGNSLLLQFQFPILAYFFAPFAIRLFSSDWRLSFVLYFILAFTLSSMLYEFTQGGVFAEFSRSGLRTVGPFVNPNNSGIFLALVATALHFRTKRLSLDVVIAAVCILIMGLSGSKTAMLLYVFGVAALVFKKPRLVFFSILFAGAAFAFDLQQYSPDTLGLREFSLESGDIRYSYAARAIELVGTSGDLSILFGTFDYSIVDNGYLDILAFGGVYLLSIFLISQAFSFILLWRRRQWLLVLLQSQIFVAMMTTNIPRLWPTAYLFWAIVGFSFLLAKPLARPRGRKLNTMKGAYLVQG